MKHWCSYVDIYFNYLQFKTKLIFKLQLQKRKTKFIYVKIKNLHRKVSCFFGGNSEKKGGLEGQQQAEVTEKNYQKKMPKNTSLSFLCTS